MALFASLFRAQPARSTVAPKVPAVAGSKRKRQEDKSRERSEAGPTASAEGTLSKSQRRKQRRKQEKQDEKQKARKGDEDKSQPRHGKLQKVKTHKVEDHKVDRMDRHDKKVDVVSNSKKKKLQKQSAESQSTSEARSGVLGKAATRLKGSRFRWLNETLYTITGSEALELFSKDPSLADAYHQGFRAQAAKWPRNPLDDVISWLKKEVPEHHVIGDFGCGDARLALELKNRQVYSFDLVQINSRVTACNLAKVPLSKASLDVAIFCLALMGTDWTKFVAEARRCLKPGGVCHIVEVESRFSDVQAVVRTIESLGFQQIMVKPGSFFVEMRFRATKKEASQGRPSHGQDALLQACTYRKR